MHKNILSLPISGGSFHVQTFLCLELIKSECIKPDVILGISGGCINAFLLCASNWNYEKTLEILNKFSSKLYCKGSILGALFRSTLFDKGEGLNELFNELFENNSITEIEILSLKTKYETLYGEISCNKDRSCLNIDRLLNTNNRITDVVYRCGNKELLIMDCLSSCSLPGIIPPVNINGENFIDGGMIYTTLTTPIIKLLPENFHINFISPYDLDGVKEHNQFSNNVIDNIMYGINNVMLGALYSERLNLINSISKNANCEEGKCSIEKLKEINISRNKYSRTLLELYPNKYLSLNITNFTNSDINNHYNEFINEGYSYRFWYS